MDSVTYKDTTFYRWTCGNWKFDMSVEADVTNATDIIGSINEKLTIKSE